MSPQPPPLLPGDSSSSLRTTKSRDTAAAPASTATTVPPPSTPLPATPTAVSKPTLAAVASAVGSPARCMSVSAAAAASTAGASPLISPTRPPSPTAGAVGPSPPASPARSDLSAATSRPGPATAAAASTTATIYPSASSIQTCGSPPVPPPPRLAADIDGAAAAALTRLFATQQHQQQCQLEGGDDPINVAAAPALWADTLPAIIPWPIAASPPQPLAPGLGALLVAVTNGAADGSEDTSRTDHIATMTGLSEQPALARTSRPASGGLYTPATPSPLAAAPPSLASMPPSLPEAEALRRIMSPATHWNASASAIALSPPHSGFDQRTALSSTHAARLGLMSPRAAVGTAMLPPPSRLLGDLGSGCGDDAELATCHLASQPVDVAAPLGATSARFFASSPAESAFVAALVHAVTAMARVRGAFVADALVHCWLGPGGGSGRGMARRQRMRKVSLRRHAMMAALCAREGREDEAVEEGKRAELRAARRQARRAHRGSNVEEPHLHRSHSHQRHHGRRGDTHGAVDGAAPHVPPDADTNVRHHAHRHSQVQQLSPRAEGCLGRADHVLRQQGHHATKQPQLGRVPLADRFSSPSPSSSAASPLRPPASPPPSSHSPNGHSAANPTTAAADTSLATSPTSLLTGSQGALTSATTSGSAAGARGASAGASASSSAQRDISATSGIRSARTAATQGAGESRRTAEGSPLSVDYRSELPYHGVHRHHGIERDGRQPACEIPVVEASTAVAGSAAMAPGDRNLRRHHSHRRHHSREGSAGAGVKDRSASSRSTTRSRGTATTAGATAVATSRAASAAPATAPTTAVAAATSGAGAFTPAVPVPPTAPSQRRDLPRKAKSTHTTRVRRRRPPPGDRIDNPSGAATTVDDDAVRPLSARSAPAVVGSAVARQATRWGAVTPLAEGTDGLRTADADAAALPEPSPVPDRNKMGNSPKAAAIESVFQRRRPHLTPIARRHSGVVGQSLEAAPAALLGPAKPRRTTLASARFAGGNSVAGAGTGSETATASVLASVGMRHRHRSTAPLVDHDQGSEGAGEGNEGPTTAACGECMTMTTAQQADGGAPSAPATLTEVDHHRTSKGTGPPGMPQQQQPKCTHSHRRKSRAAALTLHGGAADASILGAGSGGPLPGVPDDESGGSSQSSELWWEPTDHEADEMMHDDLRQLALGFTGSGGARSPATTSGTTTAPAAPPVQAVQAPAVPTVDAAMATTPASPPALSSTASCSTAAATAAASPALPVPGARAALTEAATGDPTISSPICPFGSPASAPPAPPVTRSPSPQLPSTPIPTSSLWPNPPEAPPPAVAAIPADCPSADAAAALTAGNAAMPDAAPSVPLAFVVPLSSPDGSETHAEDPEAARRTRHRRAHSRASLHALVARAAAADAEPVQEGKPRATAKVSACSASAAHHAAATAAAAISAAGATKRARHQRAKSLHATTTLRPSSPLVDPETGISVMLMPHSRAATPTITASTTEVLPVPGSAERRAAVQALATAGHNTVGPVAGAAVRELIAEATRHRRAKSSHAGTTAAYRQTKGHSPLLQASDEKEALVRATGCDRFGDLRTRNKTLEHHRSHRGGAKPTDAVAPTGLPPSGRDDHGGSGDGSITPSTTTTTSSAALSAAAASSSSPSHASEADGSVVRRGRRHEATDTTPYREGSLSPPPCRPPSSGPISWGAYETGTAPGVLTDDVPAIAAAVPAASRLPRLATATEVTEPETETERLPDGKVTTASTPEPSAPSASAAESGGEKRHHRARHHRRASSYSAAAAGQARPRPRVLSSSRMHGRTTGKAETQKRRNQHIRQSELGSPPQLGTHGCSRLCPSPSLPLPLGPISCCSSCRGHATRRAYTLRCGRLPGRVRRRRG